MSSSTEQKTETGSCGYSEFLDVLRGLPQFARVPLEVCKVLAYLSISETYQAGDVLLKEGEHAETFFYLTCGKAEATRDLNGRTVTVKAFTPGDALGGLALVLGGRNIFTVRATEETMAMTLSREKFLKTVQRFPQAEQAMLRSLAEHVLAWEERFLARHPEEFAAMGQEFGLTLF